MGEQHFDDSKKEAVLALDDEALKQAVHTLAVAGGMDARRAEVISRDAGKIRRKLSQITEADIEKMLSQIPPEELKSISEKLKKQ